MKHSTFAFPASALMTLSVCLAQPASAQLPSGWKAHDDQRPRPQIIEPGESNLPLAPPSDAIVLFDGSDLSQWCDDRGNDAKWVVRFGAMESVPGSGYVFTRQAFGDCQLHIEWASPEKVEGRSQGRGNSGVFLMGLYEVQVLDSFENETYADGQAGAIYGQFPPLVNACRKPGEWQSYDIVFRRPRFENDSLAKPARLTVFHNGVVIQDSVEAWGPTSWMQYHEPTPHADRLPLSLQDHGNPVRFRNVWIRELSEAAPAKPEQPYDERRISLTEEQAERLVGKYGMFVVERNGIDVNLNLFGRRLPLIAHSDSEFGMPMTAATITFKFGEDGKANSIVFQMGGDTMRGQRE